MEKRKQKYNPSTRRESYLRNKEKVKKYYEANKDKIRAYQKERLAKLKMTPEEYEKHRRYHRDYYHNVVKPMKKEGRLWR